MTQLSTRVHGTNGLPNSRSLTRASQSSLSAASGKFGPHTKFFGSSVEPDPPYTATFGWGQSGRAVFGETWCKILFGATPRSTQACVCMVVVEGRGRHAPIKGSEEHDARLLEKINWKGSMTGGRFTKSASKYGSVFIPQCVTPGAMKSLNHP